MTADVTTELDIGTFRAAAGRFASGVTVVTSRNGDRLYGITATSFVSLSLRPLLVTVSIKTDSPFLDEVQQTGAFAVNVLCRDQLPASQYFATRGRGSAQHAFDGITSHPEATGSPILDGSLSWFDSRLNAVLPGGDHVILVGEVVATGSADKLPLLYWNGGYRQLDPIDTGTPDTPIESLTDALSAHLHASGLVPAQLIEAQLALEPAAAELAAFHRSPEGLRALALSLERSRQARGSPEEFTAEAVAFHAALGVASCNPAITAALSSLSRSRHQHYATGTDERTMSRTIAAHQQVYDAIAAGDPVAARDAMSRHLATIGRRLGRRTAPATEETP